MLQDLSESYIAGVDEAGRGPLVGNVVVAAVILNPAITIHGLTDSKKLTAKKRDVLAEIIKQEALAWHISEATPALIDDINILQATLYAMRQAVLGLNLEPNRVVIDGRDVPTQLPIPAQAIVKGDLKIPAISAASILAKVTRDRQMLELHQQFPLYGFDRHKGYPTKEHLEKIKQYGVTSHHRRSFRPVRAAIEQSM